MKKNYQIACLLRHMKATLFLSLFAMASLLTACSSSDDDGNGGPDVKPGIDYSKVQVGWYYNSDGSFTQSAKSNSIAVVFSKTPTATDAADGYHGYAMALQNAGGRDAKYKWDNQIGNYTYATANAVVDDWKNRRDGRTETQSLLSVYNSDDERGLAAHAAATYATTNSVSTPATGNSGWFLPGIGQWHDIMVNLGGMSDSNLSLTNSVSNYWDKGTGQFSGSYVESAQNAINVYLSAASAAGATVHLFDASSSKFIEFWSSSEYSTLFAFYASFYYNGDLDLYYARKDAGVCRVRPVLAF